MITRISGHQERTMPHVRIEIPVRQQNHPHAQDDQPDNDLPPVPSHAGRSHR